MRKIVLRTLVLVCLFVAGGFFPRSQQQPQTYASLLQLYNDAQRDYDEASRVGTNAKQTNEAKEEALNASALKKFSWLSTQLPTGNRYDSLRFHTAFKVGELQHYFENYTDAVTHYKAALQLRHKNGLADSLFFKPYLYAGIIYYNQNKFDSALQFFTIAESIQKAYGNGLPEGERLYNIVGVLYYERGNYRQAQNYFQKAIEVLRRDNEAYENLFVNYHINLAQIYLKLEEYDKANQVYQKLLPLNILTNEIYHNLGTLNLSLGAAQKALTYFRKVSPTYNKAVRLYNSMGTAFFSSGQYDSAQLYFQKAVQTAQASGRNSDPVGYGLALKSQGMYAVQFQKFDSALLYYQQALRQFYPSFTETDVHRNPQTYSGVFSYINLFNTLVAKAEALHALFQQITDLAVAKEELATYQSAFRLITYVERTYESDEARLFLARIKYTVHSKPIDIAYTLYKKTGNNNYLEALYLFDQQNKATALALSRQISNEAANTNSPLLKREQELKAAITVASIRAAQITDSIQLAALNQSIRDNEIALSKVQESVNQGSAQRETVIPSIRQLQKTVLDEKTLLLSYQLSENKLTILGITTSSASCLQRELPHSFYEAFQQYLAGLKNPVLQMKAQSSQLYFHLLLDGLPIEGKKKLIIIPDNVLNYLPFEALQNTSGQYLVETVSVQYQYAAALLSKEKTNFANADVLSLAPFSSSAAALFAPLPNSREEIETLRGRQFFDTAATKSRFLQQCASYRMVHLATHAVVNTENENLSYIAFSPREQDHLLYAQEIYNLPLRNTGLIILSACETASGQLVNGEGVMSLSRAFRYAGCANVITTLWKANDFSTAYLTNRIHRYLEKGLTIAAAVQQAKKDYLKDKTVNPRLKQPYYWSHLVFIGNVQEETSFPWIRIAGIGVLVFLLLLFLLRKKSRKAGP